MKSALFFLCLVLTSMTWAQDAKTQKRLDELERSVKTMQEKIEKMESTLIKNGGFMLTANFTCEINTPFNGSYVATELSETAAKRSVMDKCKHSVPDNSQCTEMFVQCKK